MCIAGVQVYPAGKSVSGGGRRNMESAGKARKSADIAHAVSTEKSMLADIRIEEKKKWQKCPVQYDQKYSVEYIPYNIRCKNR